MDEKKPYILVEGKGDKHFLEEYISHLGYKDLEIVSIEGKDKLQYFTQKLKQVEDNKRKTAINFDADSNPETRRYELQKILREAERPSSALIFLIPNDTDTGCLEDLLEHLVPDEYKPIMTSWNKFIDSLQNLSTQLIKKENLPSTKTKFYSYASLLREEGEVEKNGAEGTRPYKGVKHWDLNTPYLDPLKSFLEDLLM